MHLKKSLIPFARSPGSCGAGWREACLGDPCDSPRFGGEKELGWGVQGSGFESWLRCYFASCCRYNLARAQLFCRGHRCPCPSFYRCGCSGTKALRKSLSAGAAPRHNFHRRLARTDSRPSAPQKSRIPGAGLRTPEPKESSPEGRVCNHCGAKEHLAYLPPGWN